jgi:hypothetical protein
MAIVATAALAGCTVKDTTVKEADTPLPVVTPAPTAVSPAAPTIAYTVTDQEQFNQAAVQAADWCRANHGTGSRVVNTMPASTGNVVAFQCLPDQAVAMVKK